MRPANGRATSSLLAGNVPDSHRPSQFRHVYQVLKGQARPNALDRDAGLCIGGTGSRGIYRARRRVKRPGPAYGLVLLGDPPSFDEDDANPQPQRCSCRAVACGDRGVSCDMGRRPLVRRRWRHGSPFPACQGMPPPIPRPPRSPRQLRLRSRTPVVPSCPVNVPKVSRGCRAAVFDAHAAGAYRPAHGASVDSPPSPEMRRRGQSVPDTGASPRRLRNAVASRKRHLGVVSRKLRLPRPRRIPADCPVARSGRDGSRPTAPGRPQTASVYRWHQGGTRKECLAALPRWRSSAV